MKIEHTNMANPLVAAMQQKQAEAPSLYGQMGQDNDSGVSAADSAPTTSGASMSSDTLSALMQHAENTPEKGGIVDIMVNVEQANKDA